MKVKIKKLVKEAVIPSYAKDGDAGMDLTATSVSYDNNGNIVYGTGLAFEIPKGYVGLLFPRSSNANTNLYLTNSVGVLDSGFRGEVKFKYKPVHNVASSLRWFWENKIMKKKNPCIGIQTLIHNMYSVGDRIGQIIIIPYPQIEFEEVEELTKTERGNGGYGSTGR